VKPKSNQLTEGIKKLLKSKIDLVNMRIVIRKFKSLKKLKRPDRSGHHGKK
jgi:hypothetical protein